MSDLTLTVGELVDAVPGLQAIGGTKVPSIIASYALAKARRKVNAELPDIEAQRVALCALHAVKDDLDHPVQVDGTYQIADMVAFQKDWQTLRAQPVTLTGVRAVSLDELAGTEISPDVVFALGPFVAEPSE
jgi:hypothetical protein